jgi:hypothetical protein
MLRYKIRRRDRQEPRLDPRTRRKRQWWRPEPEGLQRGFLTVITLLIVAKLISAAVANPTPVAMPGDIVKIAGPLFWAQPPSHIHVQSVATPWAPPANDCVLDIGLMAREGGALAVLAVRKDGVMMSWGGGPTADDGRACRPGHNGILISTADYQGLLMRLTRRH